jgi:membrane-associated phospholipid phosphatase
MDAAAFLLAPPVLTRRSTAHVAMCTLQRPENTPAVETAADLTKWAVSAAVAGALLVMHDAPTVLYVVGGVGNAALTKLAKRVINAPRPTDAPAHKKAGSAGMPSSHASALSYFSVALALWLPHPAALVAVALAAVAASWRVSARYHSWAQVAAGWALGSASATAWVLRVAPLFAPAVDAALQTQVGPWPVTVGLTAVGAAVFLRNERRKSARESQDW